LTETLVHDLRYGIRLMLKSPGFTAIAVVTLALGIGINTTIFSVMNAVLLRQLPYAAPERLVIVWEKFLQQRLDKIPVSASEFIDYQNQAQSFEQIAAFTTKDFNLTGGDAPERVSGAVVSANLFPLLGVQPFSGRTFLPEENQSGRDNVVVISYGLWQQRFGGVSNLEGSTVALDGQSCTIVGIMPSEFRFPMSLFGIKGMNYTQPPELWRPAAFTDRQLKQRGNRAYGLLGRLKPGVSLEQANAEVQVIADGMLRHYPNSYTQEGWGASAYPLREQVIGGIRPALLLLLIAVSLVLLIACGNVANLMVSRTAARQREIAVRAALGAASSRIIRQLLTESSLLAVLGGAIGLLLAHLATNLLVTYSPYTLPRIKEISVDWRVLGFTLAASAFTVLIFGLVPAWQASKIDLNTTLKGESQNISSSGVSKRLRRLTIVAELALSFLLLVGAGLAIKSLWRLLYVDPGFDPGNVVTFQVTLPRGKYGEPDSVAAFYQRAVTRVGALPGVSKVGAANILPLSGSNTDTAFIIEGQLPLDLSQIPDEEFRIVTSDYFSAMNIPLLGGRYFTDSDTDKAPGVVVINQAFVRRYFMGEDPLRKHITMDDPRKPNAKWLMIVGVVGDVRHGRLNETVKPEFYVPHLQFQEPSMTLVARTQIETSRMIPAVRGAIAELDKDLPAYNIRTMENIVNESLAQHRLLALSLGVFAGLALVLAGVGIYGVVSYGVTQRTYEIGLRMALGAQTADVLKLFIKQTVALTLIGLAVGLAAALALTRLMAALLFEVSATDPAVFVFVALLLMAVAVLACYIPARRATMIDAMAALRHQ
jgi:putative ABC transport system permease protein